MINGLRDDSNGTQPFSRGDTMVPNNTPILENQMEKKMENEMETGII